MKSFYIVLCLVLMLVSCSTRTSSPEQTSQNFATGDEECMSMESSSQFTHDDTLTMEYLAAAVQCVVDGDASGFASHCVFPISRPSPLDAIQDSAEMVRYFDILFDDSIKDVLQTKTGIENWCYMGQGFMFDSGFFWDLFHNGRIFAINYSSPKEIELIKKAQEQDMASLDPSLRGDWRLEYSFKCPNGYIIRIDDSSLITENLFRIAVFQNENVISHKPLLMLSGRKESQGNQGNAVYTFSDENGNSATFEYYPIGPDGMNPFTITINGTIDYSTSEIEFIPWHKIGK